MKITLIIFIMAVAGNGFSQSETGSFFNQNEAQRKLYLKQIASLGVFLRQLQDGYALVKNGTGAIHGFKNGEFGLHRTYFTSLYLVNPHILKDKRIKETFGYQAGIEKMFRDVLTQMSSSGWYTREETDYVNTVYRNLLDKCDRDISELSLAITPGKAQMTDAERLRRVGNVHLSMKDKHAFARSFTGDVKVMGLQRQYNNKQVETTQKLYGSD